MSELQLMCAPCKGSGLRPMSRDLKTTLAAIGRFGPVSIVELQKHRPFSSVNRTTMNWRCETLRRNKFVRRTKNGHAWEYSVEELPPIPRKGETVLNAVEVK